MRLAPVPMYWWRDQSATIRWSAESSRTTHGAPAKLSPKIREIADGSYRSKPIKDIRGTGYVVECLEAALWCFWNAHSFREAVLNAVNLGDDADTTGAVCGQLAGAYWGEGAIPGDWRDCLTMRQEISELSDQLRATAGGG